MRCSVSSTRTKTTLSLQKLHSQKCGAPCLQTSDATGTMFLRYSHLTVLRRDGYVEALVAVDFAHPAFVTLAHSPRFNIMLLSSQRPGHVDSVEQLIAPAGRTIVARGRISSRPAILSVEAVGIGETRFDARLRYGVKPPPDLREMNAQDLMVSPPILLNADVNDDELSRPSETLLLRMRSSVRIPASHALPCTGKFTAWQTTRRPWWTCA